MTFASIDPTIRAWASEHKLHVYPKHRDDEIRSVDIVGRDGNKCQVWIEAPGQDGNVRVHVWDYRTVRKDRATTAGELDLSLEQAYTTARKWLESS